jgi:beta-N-acetylhexosaminidase
MELYPDLPPYISVDQEGGIVNRLDFPGMHLSPGNMALGRVGNTDLAEEMAFITGIELREMGFHLTYAPVMDVNINPANPIIGARSFGDDVETVCRLGEAAIRGYNKSGVASCAKHFPGHGDTEQDSHLCLPSVNAGMERIRRVELPPFQASIKAGVPTIMTTHIFFNAFDSDKIPATASEKILTGLLRREMGFDGLIITDSMGMKGITDIYGEGGGAVEAVKAGADIVMMCGQTQSQLRAYEEILAHVKNGSIGMELIDTAVRRIARFKEQFVLNPHPIPLISKEKREELVKEASSRAVTVLYDKKGLLPLEIGSKKVRVFSPSRIYRTDLQESMHPRSLSYYLKESGQEADHSLYDPARPGLRETLDSLDVKPDVVIIEMFAMGVLPRTVTDSVEEAVKLASEKGISTILLPLASTYGLPQSADAAITAFNCSPVSMSALAERLVVSG